MSTRRHTLLAFASLCLVQAPAHATQKEDAAEARKIIDKARSTFGNVIKAKDLDSLRAGIRQAKAVLIFPQVLKAGFMLGGSGGTGVLLVRKGKDWSAPAFFTMGAVSFGVQAGASESEMVILVNSQVAIDSLMANSVKLGGGVSAAVGAQGVGQGANLTADFVSYAKSKGAFLGMNVEGSVLDVRDTLNRAYYGRDIKPAEITQMHGAVNAGADALRKAVAAAAG